MTYDTDITIRTSSEVKHETQEIFDTLGIDVSTAVNMFLRQVIIHHGLPFRAVLVPNDETISALDGTVFYGPFNSVEELMRDLND